MKQSSNTTDEEFYEMEMVHKKELEALFTDRYIVEIFPDALPDVERNLRRVKRKISQEKKAHMPSYLASLRRLTPGPLADLATKLLTFLHLDMPLRDLRIQEKRLQSLSRLYAYRSSPSSQEPYEATLVRAKSRLISDLITVPRSGMVRCPFHQEKTASCKVYGNRFHCFGCGEHGDVIDWVMKTENRDFKSAIQSLQ